MQWGPIIIFGSTDCAGSFSLLSGAATLFFGQKNANVPIIALGARSAVLICGQHCGLMHVLRNPREGRSPWQPDPL